MNQHITISPLTEDNVPRDFKMIEQNEKYLESYGEGYPNLKNANDYYRYLLNIYGDFQNIAMKRFTISYDGQPVGQIGLHSFCIHNFTCQAEVLILVMRYSIGLMKNFKGKAQ